MKGIEKALEKQESIGRGSSTFRPTSQHPSRRPSFDIRGELEHEAEAEVAQSTTMMSLAAMENERKELMVRWSTLSSLP